MLVLTWQEPSSGQTVEVQFDVVTADTYDAVMALSTHPVEKGAAITDHAREEPKHLSIEAFVSNTPLPSNPGAAALMAPKSIDLQERYPNPVSSGPSIPSPGSLTRAVVGAVQDLVSPTHAPKAIVYAAKDGRLAGRAREVFEKLEAARTGRLFVTVSTTLVDLDSMLIERISVARTVETFGGLPFAVELSQVRVVSSEAVDWPKPAEPRGAKKVSKGSQAVEESFLYKGGSSVGLW